MVLDLAGWDADRPESIWTARGNGAQWSRRQLLDWVPGCRQPGAAWAAERDVQMQDGWIHVTVAADQAEAVCVGLEQLCARWQVTPRFVEAPGIELL